MTCSHHFLFKTISLQRIFRLALVLVAIAAIVQTAVRTDHPWHPAAQAQATGPTLEIPTAIAASPGQSISVPLQFTSNGADVSAIIFSIDFEETCLLFDLESNGAGDNVIFQLPAGHIGTATYDVEDTDGEIDVAIFSFSTTPTSLPDETLLTIDFEISNTEACQPNSGSPLTAEIAFSSAPPPSFSDPEGADVPGTAIDGSVVLAPQPKGEIKVISSVVGEPPADDWSFAGDLGAFVLAPQGGERSFTDLDTGSYLIRQTEREAYLVSVSCDSGERGENEVTVDLGADESVTCTFVSTFVPPVSELGSITIINEVLGDPPAEPWSYVNAFANNEEPFTLPAQGGQITLDQLDAGAYQIKQTIQPEYTVSVSCDTGEKGEETVAVALGSGEAVVCTFVNSHEPSTATPTSTPTLMPTEMPTSTPTLMPTSTPTEIPTSTPTLVPTDAPTDTPTPTLVPTDAPTEIPTDTPTSTPTLMPTDAPTEIPTDTPTYTPTPTLVPTDTPTPTLVPTDTPTSTPTAQPSSTYTPTPGPTVPGQAEPLDSTTLFLPMIRSQ